MGGWMDRGRRGGIHALPHWGWGRITVPKDGHILTLGICEYVVLHGRRDFADGIK